MANDQLLEICDYLGDSLETADLTLPVLNSRPVEEHELTDDELRQKYYRLKHDLQIVLVKFQNWVNDSSPR